MTTDLNDQVRRAIAAEMAVFSEPGRFANLVELIDAEIVRAAPVLGIDPDLRQDLRASTLASLRAFLPRVASDEPERIGLPIESPALGRSMAMRGVELAVLLRIYRVAQRVVWSELMQLVYDASYTEEVRAAVLKLMWDFVNRVVESALEEVVAAYEEEAQRRLSGAVARRQEVVAALLRGDALDEGIAGQQLGHRLSEPQLAAVLWVDPQVSVVDVEVRLQGLSRELGEILGAAPLVVPSGTRAIWAWYAVGSVFDYKSLGEKLKAKVPSGGFRAALGGPAVGSLGFRMAHEDAVRAQDTMQRMTPIPPLLHYDDLELVSVVAADQQAMRRLVRRELGGLAVDDPVAERLRETLLVYLSSGSSLRAAEELSIHKNTVLYRLNQVEEMLGHTLAERRLELQVALTAARALGAAAWS